MTVRRGEFHLVSHDVIPDSIGDVLSNFMAEGHYVLSVRILARARNVPDDAPQDS